jgi:hypothetical protein
MATWLDRLPEFNNKTILVQSTLGYQMAMAYLGYRDIGLELVESGNFNPGKIDGIEDDDGPFNGVQLAEPNEDLFDHLSDQITWYNQLLGVANDTAQSEDTRLKCLTELVNQARLNQVPLLPYNPVLIPVDNIPDSALIIHNLTTGVDGNGTLHISEVERALIYSARQTFDSFAQITGAYTDNASLVAGFATKEGVISPSGNAAQFWNGNKSFAAVAFNQLTGVPTTLAGYGISASDTLFDNKYLQLGSLLAGLSTVSGTPLTAGTSVIEAFGRLQNQVTARELSLGNPAANGYVLSSTTAGVRSWIPAPTGTAVTGISLTGTNGITGSVVITTGNAVITAGTNVTGMLKGDGTSILAATEFTDYIGITGAADGDTIVYDGTAGVATWAPGLSNPMTLLGDIIYGGASGATTRLAGNTTTTNKFLRSTGVASLATAPSWEALVAGDIPDIAISQVTSLQASLDNKLDDTLTSAYMFVGNGAGAAVGVAMSGDGTLSNTGALTIANNAITFAKMQNASGQGVLIGRWNAGAGDFQEVAVDGTTIIIDAFGVMSSTGGGGTPGGSLGQIQWNNTTFGGIDRAYSDGSNVFIQAGFFSLTDVAALPSKQVIFDVSAVTLATTRTWAFPDASDTFVGLTATQTLTNKTLTSPNFNGASTVGYVWTASDTAGNGAWAAAGGGSIGGSNTQIQYNNAGAFGGVPNLLWDGTNLTARNPYIGDSASNGHFHMRYAGAVPTGVTNHATQYAEANTIGFKFGTNAFQSVFSFAGTATRTYTFPDLTGTVALTNAINVWGSGIKQTFAPSASIAGINVGSVSGDVSTPANGDLWYDSTGNLLRARINGATVSLGAGGGSGTVTNTGGALTSNSVMLGAGGNDSKVVAGITTNGTAQLVLGVNTTTLGSVKLFGSTSGDVTLQPNAVAGTAITATLPATTTTLAGLSVATQTFTTNQVISFAPTALSGTNLAALTLTGTGAAANAPQFRISGTTMAWIDLGLTGIGAPTVTNRSLGTKLVLGNALSGANTDLAIGISATSVWFSSGNTGNSFQFYGGATLAMTLSGLGELTLVGSLTIPTAKNIILASSGAGTKIGTATNQLLGFYNATPVVQGAAVADATGGVVIDAEARAAINALISRIEATGLIATV